MKFIFAFLLTFVAFAQTASAAIVDSTFYTTRPDFSGYQISTWNQAPVVEFSPSTDVVIDTVYLPFNWRTTAMPITPFLITESDGTHVYNGYITEDQLVNNDAPYSTDEALNLDSAGCNTTVYFQDENCLQPFFTEPIQLESAKTYHIQVNSVFTINRYSNFAYYDNPGVTSAGRLIKTVNPINNPANTTVADYSGNNFYVPFALNTTIQDPINGGGGNGETTFISVPVETQLGTTTCSTSATDTVCTYEYLVASTTDPTDEEIWATNFYRFGIGLGSVLLILLFTFILSGLYHRNYA
jgi:hypothetical protein